MPASLNFLSDADGAQARPAAEKMGDVISVKDFGAVGDGMTDDRAAFQAALDWPPAGANAYTSIYIPPGSYLLSDTIRIDKSHVRLFGAGDKSCLYFAPSSTGKILMMVQHSEPSQLIAQIALESFGIRAEYPTPTYAKTAIKLVDASNVTIRNVNILDLSWSGGTGLGSIALHLCGRDTHKISDCIFTADTPIYGDKNPNSTKYQFDCHTFWTLWLQTIKSSNYAIRFAPGVNPSNWVMGGNSLALQGFGGIYLNNEGETTETPSMIHIDSFRVESGTGSGGDAGGYGIFMDFGTGNPACTNLQLTNCSVNDPTCNGYHIKGVSGLLADNINCGFASGNNAFILNDVANANIRSLGIGDDAAIVQFNDMFAQYVVKLASAFAHPTNPSIAVGIYTHYDSDGPSRNLVYENGVRKWSRTQTMSNAGEMELPALTDGQSMRVSVSCAGGGADYNVTFTGASLISSAGSAAFTVGGTGDVSLVSNGSGSNKLVNVALGANRVFNVTTAGS